MKIHIANESKMSLGGGWTFIDNFAKGMRPLNYEFTDLAQAEVVLIPSASMITKEKFDEMKNLGKKIVLRIDNMPKNSRNRNCGTSRLLKFAQGADRVIYQSQWAEGYIGSWLNRNGVAPEKHRVILNGVDTEIFKPSDHADDHVYVYSRYNRDETKNFDEAWYHFLLVSRVDPTVSLKIIGPYSPELVNANFDFFDNEDVEWLGVIEKKEDIASVLRSAGHFIAPYFNDACSNSILEARACGMSIELGWSGNTGGTPEILEDNFDPSLERMCQEYDQVLKQLI